MNEPDSQSPRRKCNAKNRQGKPCKRPAGHGTNHVGVGSCRLHSGNTPNGIVSAQRKIAAQAVGMFGLPREIPPQEALMEEVYRTAGAVQWLVSIVNQLDAPGPMWGVTEERDSTGHMGDSVTRRRI